jgi:hypothetical protein
VSTTRSQSPPGSPDVKAPEACTDGADPRCWAAASHSLGSPPAAATPPSGPRHRRWSSPPSSRSAAG